MQRAVVEHVGLARSSAGRRRLGGQHVFAAVEAADLHGRELRPEHHALAPVQRQIAALLLHLRGDLPAVLPDGEVGEFLLPVLVGQHEFALDFTLELIRKGIVDEDGIFARRGLLLIRRQREKRPGAQPREDFLAVAEVLDGVFLHRLDTAARQRVMEFAHAQIQRRLPHVLGGILQPAGHHCVAEHALGHAQQALQLPVQLLDARLRGVAAHGEGIQGRRDLREALPLLREGREEFLGRRMAQSTLGQARLQRVQIGDVLAARAAAMVAHAPGNQAESRVGMRVQPCLRLFRRAAQGRIVARVDAMSHDLAAVEAHPEEVAPRQRHFSSVGSHEQIGIKARLLQQLHQSAAVAEGIEVHRRGVGHAEFFLKIRPAQLHLPDDGLARGHVAVGLKIPSAHDAPLPGAHQPANAGEQLRLVFLNPAIEQRLVVAEHEVVEFLAEVRRGAERGNRRRRALLPLPLPDGIDMGVADQMNFSHGQASSKNGIFWLHDTAQRGPKASPAVEV